MRHLPLMVVRSSFTRTLNQHKFFRTWGPKNRFPPGWIVTEKGHIPVSRGRRHTLKSGKDSKITSRVLSPQLWPHSHLSLSYISKEKKYDDLSLAEFAAGCAAILQRPTLSPLELCARIDHFAALMYLATHYTWSSVRDLHAAVLFENVIVGWFFYLFGISHFTITVKIFAFGKWSSTLGKSCVRILLSWFSAWHV